MSLTFKEKLDIAWRQGEFAYAYAKFVVLHQIDDFARITLEPDFDIALMWDERLVEEHIQALRKYK